MDRAQTRRRQSASRRWCSSATTTRTSCASSTRTSRAGGYRRVLTFDGSRTLEEVRAQRPDVLVLDLMMPRMTGFDVLAGLRDMGEARPRVIVLSARGREEDVIRAFSLGADDFMAKPFNPQELLARIARLVK